MRPSRRTHQVARLAKNISKASTRANKRAATRSYLNSYAARNDAVVEACKKKKKNLTKAEKQAMACDLDVWEPCPEKVTLTPKLKESISGGFRWILSFGVENTARQILVRNALKASGGIALEQTVFHGGRDEAVRRVLQNYQEGFDHGFELDVYKCFRSFDRAKIGSYLALPERVVTNVLSGASLNISLSTLYRDQVLAYNPDDAPLTPIQVLASMDEEWEPARQGLSEGSIASPLAAELLLAWILKSVTDGEWRIVVYADNFFCQCQNEEAAHALNFELRKLLHEHPAGPLKAKSSLNLAFPEKPFPFLGYLFAMSEDGKFSPQIGEQAHLKLKTLRKNAYMVFNAPNASDKKKHDVLKATLKKQRQIVAGFHEWKGAAAYILAKEAKLRKQANLIGSSEKIVTGKKNSLKLPQHAE